MSDLLNLSDGFLIRLAGIAVFKSGFECFQSGRVIECSYKEGQIFGSVSGTRLYHVSLRHTARHLEGRCECNASDDTEFCKHAVALALRYRQALAEHKSLASGAVLDRIQACINAMSKSELREALREIIEDDPGLQKRWSVRADLALNKIDTRLIRRRLTAALPYNKRLYRRRQVQAYFEQATAEIDLLEKQLHRLESSKALKLLDYAFQRLHRALTTIDDSHADRAAVLEALRRLHIATVARSDWSATRLVAYLEEIEASPAHDYYPTIPDDYSQNLSKEASLLYHNRKQARWDALPRLPFGADWEQVQKYLKIQSYLLARARQRDDAQAEIHLLEKTCVDTRSCLFLCQRLLDLELWEKLKYWLAKANSWENQRAGAKHLPNLDLKRLSTRLLEHQGRLPEAVDLQWQIYQQSELTADYKELVRMASLTASAQQWRARVFRRLHKNIESPDSGHFVQRTLNHLVELYLLEGQPEAALDLTNYHSLSYQALDKIIKAFSSHSEITYPLVEQQISLLMSQANRHAYTEAVALITACRKKLKQSDEQHFNVMLESVRHKYSDNPVFQASLDEAFPTSGPAD